MGEIILAVDFDGTIVEHMYPEIGAPVPDAIESLMDFNNFGAKIMLWTMRSGQTLLEAVDYCERNGITLWGVNENPEQDWSFSNKQYAHMYIDDAAVGCPLVRPSGRRPYVDWFPIYEHVMAVLRS